MHEIAKEKEKHLQIIEQLINEKKKQQEYIEGQQKQMKDQKHQHERELKTVKESLQIELKKNKEAWAAGEKLNRQKWEEQRTREIKETTIKGIQPEFEKIFNSKKSEIKQLKEEHLKEISQIQNACQEKYESKMRDLKERL